MEALLRVRIGEPPGLSRRDKPAGSPRKNSSLGFQLDRSEAKLIPTSMET
jgi:hypothetical protein